MIRFDIMPNLVKYSFCLVWGTASIFGQVVVDPKKENSLILQQKGLIDSNDFVSVDPGNGKASIAIRVATIPGHISVPIIIRMAVTHNIRKLEAASSDDIDKHWDSHCGELLM